MLRIERTDVYGWEAAIRGMRNPKNSWDKSDSKYEEVNIAKEPKIYKYVVGENDLKLMKTLANAGSEHGKFLRMVNVTMDVTAPMYWWKEFDTYKVGTVADSCSTMHKIHAKEFTIEDFSYDHLENLKMEDEEIEEVNGLSVLQATVNILNCYRNMYNKTKDKKYWWHLIQLLPMNYNQKRTIQLNYAVLRAMYKQRKDHKLDEWHAFCDWIKELPYSELIIGEE